jgi:hypothetical protein
MIFCGMSALCILRVVRSEWSHYKASRALATTDIESPALEAATTPSGSGARHHQVDTTVDRMEEIPMITLVEEDAMVITPFQLHLHLTYPFVVI